MKECPLTPENMIPVTDAADSSTKPPEEPAAQTAAKNQLRRSRFMNYGIAGILYAVFYTFCLYRNASGITHPFFVAGTLYFYCYCMKKSGIPVKKDAIFYMAATLLLGISIFLTDDARIISMNKLGIFILMISFLLHQYYADSNWGLMRHLSAMGSVIIGTLGKLTAPYTDFYAFCRVKDKTEKDHTGLISILIGLGISFPLLFIVLLLLSSADVLFSTLFTEYVLDYLWKLNLPEHFWGILWSMIIGLLIGYSLFSFISAHHATQEEPDRRTGEPLIAITFTSLLSFIYIIFCGIQVSGLFMGNMFLQTGYTYSSYARQGFFQLLFVCLINLALVLICLTYFRENRVLKILLTVISSCTYIMIASSAMRMVLYIKSCDLTFLRIFVLWALLVIFLLVTGIIISIYREQFPLFRYSMLVVTALYIVLSFSHPDYFIAKYNVSQAQEGILDDSYLYRLSADAAPVLLDRDRVTADNLYDYERYRDRIMEYDGGVRSFNLSRYLAKRKL